MRATSQRVAIALALFTIGAADVAAQLNAESFAGRGFTLNEPGARAAALGGTAIGFAHDATAADANPAGLAAQRLPQLSFEMRGVEYSFTLEDEIGGAAGGTEFTNQVPIPSFIGGTLPLGSLTVAAFRHELVGMRGTTASSGGELADGTVLLPWTSDEEVGVHHYGVALAVQRGSLSLGLAGGLARLDMDVDVARFAISRYDDAFLVDRLVVGAGSADGGGEGGESSTFFLNGGALLHVGDRVSVGAVYRMRPRFGDVEWVVVDRRGEAVAVDGIDAQGAFTLKVPDALGAGVALRPRRGVAITLDALLTRYSQSAGEESLVFTRSASGAGLESDDYAADDGLDLRAGAELEATLGGAPLALRAGIARVAPSNTYYTGPDPVERMLWGTGPDDAALRFSAGIGTVLLDRLQLDGALVSGGDRRELVGSIAWRF